MKKMKYRGYVCLILLLMFPTLSEPTKNAELSSVSQPIYFFDEETGKESIHCRFLVSIFNLGERSTAKQPPSKMA
jgi:hypothetical protein